MIPLNAYEDAQVREIASWKSERPSYLLESYRGLSRPFSKLIAKIVPKDLARKALEEVQSLAEKHDAAADILKASGSSRVEDLLGRSLQECDRLSSLVSVRAEHLALLEGVVPAVSGLAIPGVGGALSGVADVPFLLQASLRAVRRIGHCYGFPLDSEADHRFVLAILDLANEDKPAGSEEVRLGLWAPGGPTGAKLDGSDSMDAIRQSVADDLPLESIPIVGDLSNLVLDYAFVRRADLTARRVFQERWLRSNGKVESIPPSPQEHRRSSLEGVASATAELVYVGAYGVSFGAMFAAVLTGSIVASIAPEAVRRGFLDGASAADRDSGRFLEGLGQAIGSATSRRAEAVPALA
jgi:EcsC protein family